MKVIVSLCAGILLLAGCSSGERVAAQQDLAALAREYLFLELSMGMHDEAHVDAYFGPEEIRRQANQARLPLDEIGSRARQLEDALRNHPSPDSAMEQLRLSGLLGRLAALRTRIALAMGEPLPFDQETESLFGAVAPDLDDAHFEEILVRIDQLLGGEGPLPERVVEFQRRFVIPPDRLSVVFDAALAECRRRTVDHIALPADESFSVEYVTDKPWSGYNWYQGDAHSLIQVNTDLPIYISRAVDLGCHEGYPGHHTFNALLEKNLVQDRGWLEFSIYPLFSPQSLIAEGSGNYGIELAFPDDERVNFEREVLFPLAGLDPTDADRYYQLLDLLSELDYADNEAARDYLNGKIDRAAAIEWLVQYKLSSPERAEQRTRFFDAYRSYVINYNLGKDIVKQYVERDGAGPDERWQRFEQLLSSPMTASDLD